MTRTLKILTNQQMYQIIINFKIKIKNKKKNYEKENSYQKHIYQIIKNIKNLKTRYKNNHL